MHECLLKAARKLAQRNRGIMKSHNYFEIVVEQDLKTGNGIRRWISLHIVTATKRLRMRNPK